MGVNPSPTLALYLFVNMTYSVGCGVYPLPHTNMITARIYETRNITADPRR